MNNFGKYEGNLNLIGPIIKDKRKEKGMSLEALSNKLLLLGINLPITCLYRIENNQSKKYYDKKAKKRFTSKRNI